MNGPQDVTAVVLSTGEAYTERAIASAGRQTLPFADIIIVRGIRPFHHALNAGAGRVNTQFFVQVDADVVLEDTCLEELRGRMGNGVGLVSGFLRDPIVGRLTGIRLYRTECCRQVQIRDSISPDMDFGNDILARGWVRLYALRHRGSRRHLWHTFGDHLPDYTPAYTFRKFLREGNRIRYRRHEGRVRSLFRRLRHSTHKAVPIALIGTAHGLFGRATHDLLAPDVPGGAEFELLDEFLACEGGTPSPTTSLLRNPDADPYSCFMQAYEMGIQFRETGASLTFLRQLDELRQRCDLRSWLTLVGACHGLFHVNGRTRPNEAKESFDSLGEILQQGPPT